MYSQCMGRAEFEDRSGEFIIQITREEIQELAKNQFGRPLAEDELQALDDLSPIGLHDWISLAIEAAQIEPAHD